MTDIDHDPRIADLLNTAGHEATRFIHPEGVQAVRTRVRRRRRNNAIGVGVMAALVLIGGPVAAVHLTGTHPKTETPANVSTSKSTLEPSPSASAVTPSQAPSQPPPDKPSAPSAPDGKISSSTLRNTTLAIPAWPTEGFDQDCPHGKVQFSKGKSGILQLEGSPVYADVDSDGALETVSLVSCNPQGSDFKVLAFDRDAAGKIVTLGQVVASAGTAGKQGDILTIWGAESGANGQVRVDVGDYRPCCDAVQASQHQWRTYGWNGTAFTQTGGPAVFGANPKATDLSVTSPGLTMTRQTDRTWRGTLTVTVHNGAAFVTPDQVQLFVDVPDTWKATASGCILAPEGTQPIQCRVPTVAAHSSSTVTLTFTAPAGALDARCSLSAAAETVNGQGYPDVKQDKRGTTVTVTKA